MKKIGFLILGIILTILGIFFNVLYVNIFVLGYSFFDYVHFISGRIEFYFLWLGILCLFIYFKRKERK